MTSLWLDHARSRKKIHMSVTLNGYARLAARLSAAPWKHLIGGRWVEAISGKIFESFNPATGERLAALAEGDARDVDAAVAAARRAFEGEWQRVRPAERQRLLLKLADAIDTHYDELAATDTLDMGMPLSVLTRRRPHTVAMIRYYAGLATSLQGDVVENSLPGEFLTYVAKQPVGVVGSLTAWNGPLGATLLKVCPVLASGCTMVLKPAPEASLTALRIGELLLEIGVPAGVVNIVTGGATAGAALSEHPDVNKIAMTGSLATAQKIVRASAGNMKRLTLELGGKSPNIVFADADLDAAVPAAAMAIFANTGQICVAGSRLFVERPIKEAFLERLVAFTAGLKIGNGLDPTVQIGPLASSLQLERVTSFMRDAANEGCTVVTGGTRLTDGDLARGCFVSPTIYTDVRDDMRVAREEIFGPLLATFEFTDVDDVVRRANATNYGLAAGVWTRDLAKGNRVAKALQAGTVWMNCYMMLDQAMPIGGFKMSGYGREGGANHLDEYLERKAVFMGMT
jgi:aldehyde dehydrogenase (NAD+)